MVMGIQSRQVLTLVMLRLQQMLKRYASVASLLTSNLNQSMQKSTCNNMKAIYNANTNRKDLESSGIGGAACARHGCFIPHSVVDFQKGEQLVALCIVNKGKH